MTTYMICTLADDHQRQLLALEQLGYTPATLLTLDTYNALVKEEDREAAKTTLEPTVDSITDTDEVFLCGDTRTLFDLLEVMHDRLTTFRILTIDQATNNKGSQEVQP